MNTEKTMAATQYLTFILEEEVFALEIAKVREVLEFTTVTKVPRTPPFMRGVINLRGSVVPVIDLKLKFGMSRTEKTVNTCIIIMEVMLNDDLVIIGAMADSVQEVFDLDTDQVEPPPKIGTNLNTNFIQGMGKRDDHFIILLDIDRILSQEELSAVHQSGTDSVAD